jgi:hypothetical protein
MQVSPTGPSPTDLGRGRQKNKLFIWILTEVVGVATATALDLAIARGSYCRVSCLPKDLFFKRTLLATLYQFGVCIHWHISLTPFEETKARVYLGGLQDVFSSATEDVRSEKCRGGGNLRLENFLTKGLWHIGIQNKGVLSFLKVETARMRADRVDHALPSPSLLVKDAHTHVMLWTQEHLWMYELLCWKWPKSESSDTQEICSLVLLHTFLLSLGTIHSFIQHRCFVYFLCASHHRWKCVIKDWS